MVVKNFNPANLNLVFGVSTFLTIISFVFAFGMWWSKNETRWERIEQHCKRAWMVWNQSQWGREMEKENPTIKCPDAFAIKNKGD